MSFTTIGNLLNSRIGTGVFSEKVTAALVCEEFDKLLLGEWGEKIRVNAKALYLKDKVLTVACLSPVAAQEIKIKEVELLERINLRFPGQEKTIERLRMLI